MKDAWQGALDRLPVELNKAIQADGYVSAEVFEECFQDDAKLEVYVRGLLFVRKTIVLEGVTEDNLSFSTPMGVLRGMLRIAKADVARAVQEKQSIHEVQEAAALERAKVQA